MTNQRCIFPGLTGLLNTGRICFSTIGFFNITPLFKQLFFFFEKIALCCFRPSCRARRMWLKSWWKLVRMLCKAIWMAWAHYSLLPTWWPRRMAVSEGWDGQKPHTQRWKWNDMFHGTWSGVSYVRQFGRGSCYILFVFYFLDPAVLTGVVDRVSCVGSWQQKMYHH